LMIPNGIRAIPPVRLSPYSSVDAQGGVFYKSIPLPGTPTDITVSRDRKWLDLIYAAGGEGFVSVFAIDAYGDLSPVATSNSIGASAFSGVAISQ
jgi:hypothetical protein